MELMHYQAERYQPGGHWIRPRAGGRHRTEVPEKYVARQLAEGRLFLERSDAGVTVRVYSDGDGGMKPPYFVLVGRGDEHAAAIRAEDFPSLVRLLAEFSPMMGG